MKKPTIFKTKLIPRWRAYKANELSMQQIIATEEFRGSSLEEITNILNRCGFSKEHIQAAILGDVILSKGVVNEDHP